MEVKTNCALSLEIGVDSIGYAVAPIRLSSEIKHGVHHLYSITPEGRLCEVTGFIYSLLNQYPVTRAFITKPSITRHYGDTGRLSVPATKQLALMAANWGVITLVLSVKKVEVEHMPHEVYRRRDSNENEAIRNLVRVLREITGIDPEDEAEESDGNQTIWERTCAALSV